MKRLIFILLPVAALAVVLIRPGAQASPGATITVDNPGDTNSRDGVLTLREAMLLATGGLAVGALDAGETDNVLGTPGPVPADTIVFEPRFFNPGTIALNGSLPELNTGEDMVDGSSAEVIVDGHGGPGECFEITSNGNTIRGLEIYDCSHGVEIDGQDNTLEGNVISGHSYGVLISGSSANNNVVKGNYIGTNAAGTTALPNDTAGILIDGQNNTLEDNVISGNLDAGVVIGGSSAKNNVVKGNYIGTNAAVTAALPNGDGVWIASGAQNNTIDGNVISGNSDSGVEIHSANADNNVVKGNRIGTNASGTVALPNGTHGVRIWAGAENNTVGGATAGERNVISGNGQDGVRIEYLGTNGNVVKGNYIGINASGTAALPNSVGVAIEDDAGNNTVEGNVISGNGSSGVRIYGGGTRGNVVKGNYIGTNASGTAALPNGTQGVLIESGPQSNAVGGTAAGDSNTIAFNNEDGVQVFGGATTGNTIRGNSIHSNGGKGIENTSGGNTELPPPSITGFGSVVGTACPNCTIDVYSDEDDEGRVYEGSTTAAGDGNWSFPGSLNGPNITATATDSAGNTSELSAAAALPGETTTPTATPSPTATPTPPVGPTRTLYWGPGWHNETWSGSSTPEEAFACAAGNYAAAYRYVGGGFQRYFPDHLDISNMSDLQQYDTFFILITDDVTCEMPVADPPGGQRILDWSVGWQNEAWTGPDGTQPIDPFACAAGNYTAAYRLVGGGWERHFPDRPDISNMGLLNKYDAFLILMTAPVSCTMPVAP